MSKELYTKRLAEVLGVTQRNMEAAIAFVDKEFAAAEIAEQKRAETPIVSGVGSNDKFDNPAPLTPEELEQLDTDSHNEDEAAFSDADQTTVESDDAEADKY